MAETKYDTITRRGDHKNNGVKWRWFILPTKIKIEQINDYLKMLKTSIYYADGPMQVIVLHIVTIDIYVFTLYS